MQPEAQRALLQRFEPILRFTRGEQFFPMDVARYVRQCSLQALWPGREVVCLARHGELELDDLARLPDEIASAIHYLNFIDPLSATELAAYALQQRYAARDPQDVFHAGPGRLARVGYLSRFVDALFSLGLLARGRVPGDAAAAADITYQQIRAEDPRSCYYGRVVQQDGWVALQYWFFYPFNNWRSGFFGANDHEADWEMVCVYLAQAPDGALQPEWVAYASHDYTGDDLRRRWDDPELEKVGDHPVCYVAAGSHASYFSPGEYLTEIELRFLAPLGRLTDRLQRLWHQQVRQYREFAPTAERPPSRLFRIPFVDYARGDGVAIGPGQTQPWSDRVLIDPPPPWVSQYRGLWGLYTRDPFAGEDAPAGPMFNRDGTIRRAWHDPVGWAGLHKVAPAPRALEVVLQRQESIRTRQAGLRQRARQIQHELRGLGMEAVAMHGQRHLIDAQMAHRRRIRELNDELSDLRAQIASDEALLDALDRYAARLRSGERESPRAHLRRPHMPTSPTELRFRRVAEFWAAASIGLMLVSVIALVLFARAYLVVGIVAMAALFLFLEASFRGRLIRLLSALGSLLATLAALVLLYEFWWPLLIVAMLLAGGYILFENLRELRS